MPAGYHRTFNGKKFHKVGKATHKKSKAKKSQNFYRLRGCKTRIVQDMVGWYHVYVRCSRK